MGKIKNFQPKGGGKIHTERHNENGTITALCGRVFPNWWIDPSVEEATCKKCSNIGNKEDSK